MQQNIWRDGLMYAAGTVAYILAVAAFMSNAEKFFGKMDDGLLAPVVFLTLFVVSGAITASLVFGKPVMLYADGAKKMAVKQLASTIIWLLLALVLFVAGMVMVK